MLYLETGLSPLHILTAETHFRYIQNVVTMPEHRLQRILVMGHRMGDACRDLRRKVTVRRSFTMVAMVEKYL